MPAIALLAGLGWQAANCYHERFGAQGTLGRETPAEVVLSARLLPALRRLNPGLSEEALHAAAEELQRERSALGMTAANQEVYRLLKEGVPVSFRDEEGIEHFERVRVIDWDAPRSNDFFLASQLWISGEIYKRRADLIGFVNGLPLVFIELKAAHKDVKDAYVNNLRDYKTTIPQVFPYNGLIILSNGGASRLGSVSAEWEHFVEWKKINNEGEQGVVSLETMLRGTCELGRLLDLVENFTLFEEAQGGLRKIIAKNHQYLGVNSALQAVREMRENQGKLGIFWHTQGSGKSYAMVFFAQKVLRKLPGNWTFLIVTDRQELDQQIYKNFANCGIVTESEENVRASSGAHLQLLLQEDHRFLFTLIQKFQVEKGRAYPQLSQREDIIVMTDEAHRTQYDVLALNMRNALPRAAFLAFTGTPLMAGEEKTRAVFGEYVSIYNFKQSVEDQATVPLFYENRIPELQIVNPNFNQDMTETLEQASLDEAQEKRLEREFSREYHLITRSDRLQKVAEDLVMHFLQRGFQGKAMVISIDKATAVKMYDKVRAFWNYQIAATQADLEDSTNAEEDRQFLQSKLDDLLQTDMAVVVSQGQNEIDDLKAKGVDILPHRRRMVKEDLASKFKDPADPLRLVFVCAMWLTGFDAPSCSTLYLDKPMQNHTLMQTIARANRVWGEKYNGLIVDYIGVFRDLQKALAIYGSGTGGAPGEGELPVQGKPALVEALQGAIARTRAFLQAQQIDLDALHAAQEFQRVRLLTDFTDALLKTEAIKLAYLNLAGEVERLFQAVLPDAAANPFGLDRKAIQVIAQKIHSFMPPADISEVMAEVEELLDESIAPKGAGYVIHAPLGQATRETDAVVPSHWLDLSRIDFEALKQQFETGHKHIEVEKLRGALNTRLKKLVRLNPMRMDYYEQFQRMIDAYNAGAQNVDALFAQLVSFAQNLNEEEQRGIAENLSEEELAIFDLLTRPDLKLSKNEQERVRQVSRQLLDTLKAEYLVLDWRKHQKTRAGVQLAIEEVLDRLPPRYESDLYQEKCTGVYQHVYDRYFGAGKSVYGLAVGRQ
jgi:type I restriction enzyme R subunit